MMKRSDNNYLIPLNGNSEEVRRQDIDEVFYLEGSVYASFTKEFKECKSFLHSETRFIEVPEEYAIEIDNMLQYKIACFLMNELGKNW